MMRPSRGAERRLEGRIFRDAVTWPASARQQQPGQFVGHAQHRVMPGIELGPFGAEPVGGAALMGFARVLRLAAPDDARLPFLRPERIELDRVLVDADRVGRVARDRPRADLWTKIGEGVL